MGVTEQTLAVSVMIQRKVGVMEIATGHMDLAHTDVSNKYLEI